MFEPQPRGASEGSTLHGFAVSPGRATAAASVIRSPAEFDKMIARDIESHQTIVKKAGLKFN